MGEVLKSKKVKGAFFLSGVTYVEGGIPLKAKEKPKYELCVTSSPMGFWCKDSMFLDPAFLTDTEECWGDGELCCNKKHAWIIADLEHFLKKSLPYIKGEDTSIPLEEIFRHFRMISRDATVEKHQSFSGEVYYKFLYRGDDLLEGKGLGNV